MNEGPAERDRFKSDFLFAIEENFTSCLAQLFDLAGLVLMFEASFKVEFVRDDFRFGGGGGTTGT